MPLTLNNVAGFSDIQNFAIAADSAALAIHVGGIANNAALGMTRMEFFQQKYINGDTVILPQSPIDRYSYSRDELLYLWAIASSQNPTTHWLTGPDCLWYLNHKVDQSTGAVSCEEFYRKSSMSAPDGAISQDGVLLVTTIAQRQLTNLIIAHQPSFQGDLSPSIGVDKAWQQCLTQRLNVGAKFSIVNTECIYMGEFIDGQTVPTPVSPADGYAYSYPECFFYSSWRWTTAGDVYVQPRNELGQLQRMQMSVSSVGVCAVRIDMKGADDTVFTSVRSLTNVPFGRIAVWALTSRNQAIGAVGA